MQSHFSSSVHPSTLATATVGTATSWLGGFGLAAVNVVPNPIWGMLYSALVFAFAAAVTEFTKRIQAQMATFTENQELKQQMASKDAHIAQLSLRIMDGEKAMTKMDTIMRKQESSEHRVLGQIALTKAVAQDTNNKINTSLSSDEIPTTKP